MTTRAPALLKIIESDVVSLFYNFFVLWLDLIEYFFLVILVPPTFSTLSLDIEIKDCELLQPITTSLV